MLRVAIRKEFHQFNNEFGFLEFGNSLEKYLAWLDRNEEKLLKKVPTTYISTYLCRVFEGRQISLDIDEKT